MKKALTCLILLSLFAIGGMRTPPWTASVGGGSGGADPSPPDTSIQFNYSNDFGGSSNLTWTGSTGTEVLDETDFATHAKWASANDMDDTVGAAFYMHDSGSGTLTQVNADLTSPADSTAYTFIYTTSQGRGDPACVLSTPFTTASVALTETDGYHETSFTSSATASGEDFVITCTSDTWEDRVQFDTVSLKLSGGTVVIGSEDTAYGQCTLHGDSTTGGGKALLYNAASEDGTIDYYQLEPDGTNFELSADTTGASFQVVNMDVIIGSGAADKDYSITFDGDDGDCLMYWDEGTDVFHIDSDLELAVKDADHNTQIWISDFVGQDTGAETLYRTANGTYASPTALLSGEYLGTSSFWGRGATIYKQSARISAVATENFTDANFGSELRFYTSDNTASTITENLVLEQDGDLTWGAGTTGKDYVLTVDGETNDGTLTYMEDEDRFDFDAGMGIFSGQYVWSEPVNTWPLLTNTNSGEDMLPAFIAQDADGTDNVYITLAAKGVPGNANYEHFSFGWNNVWSDMFIRSSAGGTGTLRPISVRMDTAEIWEWETDGDVVMGAGAAGKDYTLKVDGQTNDLVLTALEDEKLWQFDGGRVVDTESVTCSADACTYDGKLTSSYYTTENNAAADVVTVADGVTGQRRTFVLKTDGGDDLEVTPTNFANGTKITLDTAGESVTLEFDGTNWFMISTYGGVVS